MSFEEIQELFRQSTRALKLFELASQRKPAMELARLTMLNALVQIAQSAAIDALRALPADERNKMIEQFDTEQRVERAKAGLISVVRN